MSENLVTYFSCTGITKNAAEDIASIIDGDIFKIEAAEPYTSEDLNWRDSSTRATQEMQDEKCRPEIASKIDLDSYDKIFIGFPIWWGKAPRIINTFIESNDLNDKEIILFCTSGSSPIEGAESELKNEYPELDIVSAKRISNGVNIKSWISEVD